MLQASMVTIGAGFEPCGLSIDGRPQPLGSWDYDEEAGVLRTILRGRSPRLVMRDLCRHRR